MNPTLLQMAGSNLLTLTIQFNSTQVAATNRPDLIDSALLRPGRIDRVLYVPPPDAEARKEIFNIHLRKTPIDADNVSLDELAVRSDGHSGEQPFP